MQPVDHDVVIVGGGPAGLTAGIYASRAMLDTLMIEKAAPGGQILLTDWMENYPGFPEGLTGADLVQKMRDQALKFGLRTEINEVVSLDLSQPVKKLQLSDRTITARSIIVATGAHPRKIGIPGENRFFGKGVSTCATCDAPFYKDRVVVAVGGGDTAVQESLYLTKFARKVYLIHRRDQLRATRILQERAFNNDKIEIIWDSVPMEISGFFNLEAVRVKNVKTAEVRTIQADGCFIWVGTLPNSGFLNGGIQLDPNGFVVMDVRLETSVPGV
ncbi:MAG: FAD-dependent oxidoreductase, partial [Desulfosarcina sp.]|nr:FAD-dependent oxidoreductase [Desulfobacterales bacterium]